MTSEKEKYCQLYEECKEELHATRRELMKNNSKSSNVSLAAQAILKRVEKERDNAVFDLRNVITERETLKETLKQLSETAAKEKQILENDIDELDNRIRNVRNS